jgi:hypothetical protein
MRHISHLRPVLAALLLLPLAACNGFSPSVGGAQFSSAVLPLPANYRAIIGRAAAKFKTAPGQTLGISEPKTVVGVTALDPQRWYVCLAGVLPPPPRPGQPAPTGRYDTVAILEPIGPPGILHAYDSPLCRDATYSPFAIPKAPDAAG